MQDTKLGLVFFPRNLIQPLSHYYIYSTRYCFYRLKFVPWRFFLANVCWRVFSWGFWNFSFPNSLHFAVFCWFCVFSLHPIRDMRRASVGGLGTEGRTREVLNGKRLNMRGSEQNVESPKTARKLPISIAKHLVLKWWWWCLRGLRFSSSNHKTYC